MDIPVWDSWDLDMCPAYCCVREYQQVFAVGGGESQDKQSLGKFGRSRGAALEPGSQEQTAAPGRLEGLWWDPWVSGGMGTARSGPNSPHSLVLFDL